MKKFILRISLPVFIFCGAVHARENWERVPLPNSYVSESVNLSTNTAVLTLIADVGVSSYPVLLHTVTINTPGTSSTLEIFDASRSTLPVTNARRIARIDTTSKKTLTYDVYCSSGLAIYNYGSTPADITITYREK